MNSLKKLFFALLLAFLVAACGGNDAAQMPDGPSVVISSPADGQTLKSPVSFSMTANEFTIEEAGEVNEGAGHFHLIVDHGCVPVGEVIPATEGYNHFGKAQLVTELELAPGDYDICLQVGDGLHVATELTYEISITVEE